jgi:hypothetical protein
MPRKSPVRLTFAEKYKITLWLGAQAERILAERPTGAVLSQQVAEALHLHVNEELVRELAETAGLTWEPLYATGPASRSSAHHRIAQLTAAVAEHQKIIEALTRDVAKLSDRLDAHNTMIAHVAFEAGVTLFKGS